MVAVIDYDAGNIKSVEKALVHLGADDFHGLISVINVVCTYTRAHYHDTAKNGSDQSLFALFSLVIYEPDYYRVYCENTCQKRHEILSRKYVQSQYKRNQHYLNYKNDQHKYSMRHRCWNNMYISLFIVPM